ncbi:MAG: hypothetical protein ACK4Z6_03135 [Candidatus Methylomirabilales bacterium]
MNLLGKKHPEERSRVLHNGPYSVVTSVESPETVKQRIRFDQVHASISTEVRADALVVEWVISGVTFLLTFRETPWGTYLDHLHLALPRRANFSVEVSTLPEVGVQHAEVDGQRVLLTCTHPLVNRAEEKGDIHYPPILATDQTVLVSLPAERIGLLLPRLVGASLAQLKGKAQATGVSLVPAFFASPDIGKAPSGSAYGLYAVHEILDQRFNFPETFQKIFLYVAQVFGHTTGWTRMWLETFLDTPYENRSFFAHKPGADRERLLLHFSDLDRDRINARLVDLYYTDRVTARINPKEVKPSNLPGPLTSWEASLLFIGQNMDLVRKALSAAVIFSDLREEVGLVINHLLASMGIRGDFVLVANRYAHRIRNVLGEIRAFPEPLRGCLDGYRMSYEDMRRFFSSRGFDPESIVDFFQSSRIKVESLFSEQGLGFELFQTISFEKSLEGQPGVIQIPPIANVNGLPSGDPTHPVLAKAAEYLKQRLKSLGREDLAERLEGDPKTRLILCAQGPAPYLYAKELWGTLLEAAWVMPEAIFLMAGAEEELEHWRRRAHPPQVVFLGWEPRFRNILTSFHFFPNSLLVTRPGMSMLGLALCSGIGPILSPPDRLVDLPTGDERLAALVGEVQDERTIHVAQYLLFLRRGGLTEEEVCRQILLIKDTTPERTAQSLREAIALQPKVRRIVQKGIYPSIKEDLFKIFAKFLDGVPLTFEEIKAQLQAAGWRR